jgi:hypothetical protein
LSAFDISVNVGNWGFGVPDPQSVKSGEVPSSIDTILNVVQVLETQGGVAAVPLGNLKYTMGRDDAIRFFKTGLEQAEALPPQSKLAVATDLSQAEQMGRQFEDMRDGGA